MRNHPVASWLLRRFLPADHAEAMLGDLLETSGTDGARFRRELLGTLWSLGWRTLVAFATAAVVGCCAILNLEVRFADSVMSHHPTALQQSWASTVAFLSGCMCVTACFALVRYGWKDRIALLTAMTAALGACATWFWWLPAVPIAACAGFLLLSIFNVSRKRSRGPYGVLTGLVVLQPLLWFGGMTLLLTPMAMFLKHSHAEISALQPLLVMWLISAYLLLTMMACAVCAKARRWATA